MAYIAFYFELSDDLAQREDQARLLREEISKIQALRYCSSPVYGGDLKYLTEALKFHTKEVQNDERFRELAQQVNQARESSGMPALPKLNCSESSSG